jgi:hypothetical protein
MVTSTERNSTSTMDHPDHRLHDGPTTTGANALADVGQEGRLIKAEKVIVQP